MIIKYLIDQYFKYILNLDLCKYIVNMYYVFCSNIIGNKFYIVYFDLMIGFVKKERGL